MQKAADLTTTGVLRMPTNSTHTAWTGTVPAASCFISCPWWFTYASITCAASCDVTEAVAQATFALFWVIAAACTLINTLRQRCCRRGSPDVEVDTARTAELGIASVAKQKLLIAVLGMLPWLVAWSGVSRFCWARLGSTCYNGGAILLNLTRGARIVGVVGMLVCSLLFISVHVAMADAWDPVPTAKRSHTLVTRRFPFNHARHPMYAVFFNFVLVGPLLGDLNWVLAVSYIPFLARIAWRIPVEERIMIHLFADEYLEYQRRVGPLGPKAFCCTIPRGLVGYGAPNRDGGVTASSWSERRRTLLDDRDREQG